MAWRGQFCFLINGTLGLFCFQSRCFPSLKMWNFLMCTVTLISKVKYCIVNVIVENITVKRMWWYGVNIFFRNYIFWQLKFNKATAPLLHLHCLQTLLGAELNDKCICFMYEPCGSFSFFCCFFFLLKEVV